MLKVHVSKRSKDLYTGTIIGSIVFPFYGDIAQGFEIVGVTEARVREAFAKVFNPNNIEIVFEEQKPTAPLGESESEG